LRDVYGLPVFGLPGNVCAIESGRRVVTTVDCYCDKSRDGP
jgi:hypothetical protein